ncbi:unnamed protein product [Bursaphelenchus xylophilus]|uniref:(pine wood nematode) hypothetical protein n=1 Tax=Bursaphelenchus xylophilus TaxID=6326 RepID=A0A1I7RT21_BURXY|nr:unnamed protein product [Bursaphelenchus xylophilus]CAG9122668.1 unnamed protein product [Bursaphelenchus xylophilus]
MAMEPIVQLGGKYKEELSATFEGLRQRSSVSVAAAQEQLQLLQQQAEQLKQSSPEALVGTLQDLSPVEVPTPKLLDTFGWLTVMEVTKTVVSVLTSYLLAPFIGLFFESLTAIVLAYGVVPALLYRQLTATESDTEHRFYLLSAAAAEGLLVGFIINNRYLAASQPIAAVTPLFIALVAQLGEGKFPSRQAFLGATLGSGVLAHLALSILFGSLSFPGFLLSALYAGVGFASIQLLLKDSQAPSYKYQFIYFIGAILSQGIVFGIFGGAPPAQN